MEAEIEIEKEIVSLTLKTVEFLLSKNPDSLSLYLFYYKNAKIQKTNQIWNTDTFGMNGLGWGKKRYTDAKEVLFNNNLVEIVRKRDDKGRLDKTFIKLKYIHKYQNPQVDTPTGGERETNALSNKKEMLKVIKDLSTDVSEIPSDTQVIDLPKQKGELPLKFGKSYIDRVMFVYRTLWKSKFNTPYRISSFGKLGSIIKALAKDNTEYQIALLLLTHFNWRGATGNDEKEYMFLSGKGFPLELLPSKINIYIAYLTNTLGVEYTNEDSVKSYVVKNLKPLLEN